MATKKTTSSFTSAQKKELEALIASIVDKKFEELKKDGIGKKNDEKNEKKSSKKEIPAFNKLKLEKQGKVYLVKPNGKLKNAFSHYNEDAEKNHGEYVKYDKNTNEGAWWKFSKKADAEAFIEVRKQSYEAWAKAQA